jgi:LuxR family maltose regulon positive regulatory protein
MLWIHQAWATWIDYRSNEVTPLLDRVDAETISDQTKGHLLALRANLAANAYDLPAVSGYATSALELLPPNQRFARANVFRLQAIAAQFADRRTEALDAYRNVVDIARDAGLTHLRILAETGRGIVLERNLALTEATARYNEVLRLAGDPDQPVTCEAHAGLGRIAYLKNDLDVARQQLALGRDLAKQIQGIDSDLSAEIELGRVQAAAGDMAGAGSVLRRLAAIISDSTHAHRQNALRSARIRHAIEAGHADEIRELFEELENLTAKEQTETVISAGDTSPAIELDRIRILLFQGNTEGILPRLSEIENRAVERGHTDLVVECGVLTSITLSQAGDRDQGVRNLRTVWEILRHENATRPILDEGPVARELFEEILAGRGLVDPGLSKREREVLRHIEAGLSNEEIAERLFVSVSTIKGHNSRIFEKLGVHRRTEAVLEGRRRGFLNENST